MIFLIDSWKFIGISAPRFAWLAAGLFLLFSFLASGALFLNVRDVRAAAGALSFSLEKLPKPTLGSGLSLTEVEELNAHFDKFPSFGRSWTQLQSKLIRRRGLSEDEYWLSVPASEVLQPSAVTDVHINRDW